MNKSFQLISDILRGQWLIHGEWADAHLPIVARILNHESIEALFPGSVSNAPVDDKEVYLVEHSVAVISVSGPLTKFGGMCSYGTVDYTKLLQVAMADDSVRGIIIMMDSPGGSIAGIDTFYSLIENRTKPVIGVIDDLAGSGGYYMIAGADRILLRNKTSIAGSIGAMVTIRDYSAKLAALGISEKALYSRLSPLKNNESRALNAGDETPMLDALDTIAGVFHERVKAGRGDKLKDTADGPLSGAVFVGQQAIDVGLADDFGDLDDAYEAVMELVNGSSSPRFSITNNSNMFGDKYPRLTALRGVAAADVSSETLDQINAQLAEKGIEGVVVVNRGWLADAENLETQLGTQTSEVTRLTAELATQTKAATTAGTKVTELEGQVTTLTAQVSEWKEKAVKFGAQPDADPANPAKKDEVIPDSQGGSQNPFLSETDMELAQLRQRAGLN